MAVGERVASVSTPSFNLAVQRVDPRGSTGSSGSSNGSSIGGGAELVIPGQPAAAVVLTPSVKMGASFFDRAGAANREGWGMYK